MQAFSDVLAPRFPRDSFVADAALHFVVEVVLDLIALLLTRATSASCHRGLGSSQRVMNRTLLSRCPRPPGDFGQDLGGSGHWHVSQVGDHQHNRVGLRLQDFCWVEPHALRSMYVCEPFSQVLNDAVRDRHYSEYFAGSRVE